MKDDDNVARAIALDSQTPSGTKSALKRAELLACQLNTESSEDIKGLLKTLLDRIVLHPNQLILELDLASLRQLLLGTGNHIEAELETECANQINVPHKLKRRGVEAKLVLNTGRGQRAPIKDENLIRTIAKAHHWLDLLTGGSVASISEVAAATNEDRNEINRFLPLAFLPPDIVEAIVNGYQPVDLTLERIRRIGELPIDWQAQRSILGFQP